MDRAEPWMTNSREQLRMAPRRGVSSRAEGMRNEQIVNGRRARGRLLAALSTALLVLACWGLSLFPAKAEAPQASNSGNSQAEKPGEPPSAGQALGRKTDQFRLSKEAYRKAVAYSKAWYRLYFVSVGWSILVLWLLLRL